MVMDEIDTCIIPMKTQCFEYFLIRLIRPNDDQ